MLGRAFYVRSLRGGGGDCTVDPNLQKHFYLFRYITNWHKGQLELKSDYAFHPKTVFVNGCSNY